MEPNFQTSFIPKKPMIEERVKSSHPIGIFMVAALFFLVAMIIGTGGLYFYKGVLNKSIDQSKADLNLAQGQFEPATISELKVLDKRLTAANEILSKHVSISPIFKALQDLTLKTVRFTKFNFDDAAEGKVHVSIQGVAIGYRSIALQSDLFAKNKNLLDPVFSNLVLDDKGNVVFNLDFTVDPTFIDYKHTIGVESAPTT